MRYFGGTFVLGVAVHAQGRLAPTMGGRSTPTSDTDDPSAKKLVANAIKMTIPSTHPPL